MKNESIFNIETVYKDWLKDKETERRWRSKPLSYFESKKIILLDSSEKIEYIAEYGIETPMNYMEFCKDVLKSRWKEKENFISEDYYASCIYALTVIKDRWIENEYIFVKLNNSYLLKVYIKTFFGNHFPENEVETNPLFEFWYDMTLEKIINQPKLINRGYLFMTEVDLSAYISEQKQILNSDSYPYHIVGFDGEFIKKCTIGEI